MANLDKTIWGNAQFITTPFEFYDMTVHDPWHTPSSKEDQGADIPIRDGLPMFRKLFTAKAGEKAELNFTALGVVDLWLNGKRIGNDELKPGWSFYPKRTLSMTYDLTDLLVEGENCLLAIVSNGYYSGRISVHTYGDHDPAFLARLTVGDQDIVTDTDWQTKIGGQILAADIWDGERKDARLDCYCKISRADYDTADWGNANIADYFDGEVTPFVGPTVQVRPEMTRTAAESWLYEGIEDNGSDYGEIKVLRQPDTFPITIKKGQTLLIDMAQNMVGWAKIKVSGASGTTVKIRYAEMRNDSGDAKRGNDGPKGSAYVINYRTAKAKGHYTLKGCCCGETYTPTFTYYGFRYVELTADADFTLLDFSAEVVGSVTRETGSISTSNAEVNQLISNVLWGQRGNYVGVPTDCPQRDERLGWTGDTQIFCRTAAYNADVCGFFHKWMQDMRDSQNDAGAYPDVAPWLKVTGYGVAAWADAGIIVPYQMYTMFGDKSIIEENYASMEKYMDFIANTNGLNGPNAGYGDWLAYEGTPSPYVSVAYYAYDTELMAVMSAAIGRDDRAAHYAELNKQIKEHFKAKYMADGKLTVTTQTAYMLALKHDLLPEDYREEAIAALLEKIKANGYKLSSGFVGAGIYNQTLSELGLDKMAYNLLLQTENPSWLYSVRQGATTIWERWNSYTLATGFGDAGMNSFNHYAYGSVCEWMYRFMAGIETDGYGFPHIILQPRPDTRTADELPEGQTNITWVKASYDSCAGLIESAWSTENGFRYTCTVPECGATLYLPKMGGSSYMCNGISKEIPADGEQTVKIELAAGKYEFIVE